MPELPDVEIFKRYVDSKALRKKIKRVEVTKSRVVKGTSARGLSRKLAGASLSTTRRHGKDLFIRATNGTWLLVHFGMTGYFAYAKDKDELPRHARVLVHFANGYWLAYVSQRMLGKIEIVDDPGVFAEKHKLGPDALGSDMDADAFRRALEGARGTVKSALMDQGRVAGVGNIYADEILFQAGISPKKKADALSGKEIKRLFTKMNKVLKTAIDKQANPEKMPRSWLLPRRDEGESCPRCRGAVKRIKISGRSSYYCPKCQK